MLTDKLKKRWNRITKHGLFLQSLKNILSKLGINIDPYWIEKEGIDLCQESFAIANSNSLRLSFLDYSELNKLTSQFKWYSYILEKFKKGNYKVIGLYEENRLAAFTMAQFKNFELKGKKYYLKSNEAYLENMYTIEDYRGRNIAPYLRYHAYKLLMEEGKTKFFSATEYFNKSSLKFKKKLNAKHLELRLHISLFQRIKLNFLLKKYGNNDSFND